MAQILDEELSVEAWGDIDPYLFEAIAEDPEDSDDERDNEDVESMRSVLERVVKRINVLAPVEAKATPYEG